MEFVRPTLGPDVLRTADIDSLPEGAKVLVAGWPVARQHPRGLGGDGVRDHRGRDGGRAAHCLAAGICPVQEGTGEPRAPGQGRGIPSRRNDERHHVQREDVGCRGPDARRPRLALSGGCPGGIIGWEGKTRVRKIHPDSRPGRPGPAVRVRRQRLQLRSRIQHRSHGERSHREERGGPGGGVHALGTGALLGQGPEDRGPDDQRPGGDGGREARLPQRPQEAALPGPRRRLLRVAEDAGGQEAL